MIMIDDVADDDGDDDYDGDRIRIICPLHNCRDVKILLKSAHMYLFQ